MQQNTAPSIQDGNIPSGSRSLKIYRPATTASVILLAESFNFNPAPINVTDRMGQQGEYTGGVGRSGKTTGTATVQNIFDGADQVIVKPGDVFSEKVNASDADYTNFFVLEAPYDEQSQQDRKQNITFQAVANPDDFSVNVAGALVAVAFPIV